MHVIAQHGKLVLCCHTQCVIAPKVPYIVTQRGNHQGDPLDTGLLRSKADRTRQPTRRVARLGSMKGVVVHGHTIYTKEARKRILVTLIKIPLADRSTAPSTLPFQFED